MFARAVISRGISTQRLSKNVTLYVNELAPAVAPAVAPRRPLQAQEDRPLLLMLPWLGSRPQAVAKYCDIYFHRGMDVLVVESEVSDFLWPRWGVEHGQKLLDLLQSERFESRPLLVHAFSIGAYTFAQLLTHVYKDTTKYETLTKRIKGQVYDSMVIGSVEHMAIGVGKTVFPKLEFLITRASLAYFSLFKHQTVDYFNTAINAFWNTPVTAPVVLFYCENDPLSNWVVVDELAEDWCKRGMSVTLQKWEKSTHAGHLKRHPQEYLSTINTFLNSLDVGHLQSKL